MKIYAVGDSFTAGSELVDYKYYKDYPGYTTAIENRPGNPHSEWYRKRPWLHTFVGGHRSPGYQAILDEQKGLTYANQLGEILGLPVVNHGVGGCSQDTILRNLTLYLDTLTEPHIVFFQGTSSNRWCQYYENTWRDFIAGNPDNNVSKEFESWMRLKITLEDDYSWAMRWWLNFKSAVAQLKTHNMVKKFYIVDSGNLRWTRTHILQNPDRYSVDNLGERILRFVNDETSDCRLDFPYDSNEPVICPGGHVNHIVHRRLAEQIAEKISPTLLTQR